MESTTPPICNQESDHVWYIPTDLLEHFIDDKVETQDAPIWHKMPIMRMDSNDPLFDLVNVAGGCGLKLLGGLLLIIRAAINSPYRGFLLRVRGASHIPHTFESLAVMSRQTPETMKCVVNGLIELRWLNRESWPLSAERLKALSQPARRPFRPPQRFQPHPLIDELQKRFTGVRFADLPRRTQDLIEANVRSYSAPKVAAALTAATKNPHNKLSIAEVFARMAFDASDEQKGRPRARPAHEIEDY